MAPGSAAVNWISVGGTSLSTPQWAGLVAVANALRVQAANVTFSPWLTQLAELFHPRVLRHVIPVIVGWQLACLLYTSRCV